VRISVRKRQLLSNATALFRIAAYTLYYFYSWLEDYIRNHHKMEMAMVISC